MHIRPFHIDDIDALSEIAQISFAAEYTADGSTPESFARQIRLVTRGRMIPFKLFTSLVGYRWELFVAEAESKIVGCGAYIGQKQVELSNLMVHPDYRRRGIGQALLIARLQRLRELGYPYVTTTVLSTNQASLGNLAKQEFEAFDRYTILESALSSSSNANTQGAVTSRPLLAADRANLQKMEAGWATPQWLRIEKTASGRYFHNRREQIFNRLLGNHHWSRVFSCHGDDIGYLAAFATNSQSKGHLSRPVVPDSQLERFPEMLAHAADWLHGLGKTSMRIAIPDARQSLLTLLQDHGWKKSQTMVRLVRWLDT